MLRVPAGAQEGTRTLMRIIAVVFETTSSTIPTLAHILDNQDTLFKGIEPS